MKKLFCLFLLLCSSVQAEINFNSFESNDHCLIEYSYLFSTAKDSHALGRVPMVIRINNKTADKHTWYFESKSNWQRSASILKKSLSVEANSTRVFILSVPYDSDFHGLPQGKISGFSVKRDHYFYGNSFSDQLGLVATSKAYNMLSRDNSRGSHSYDLISPKTLTYFPDSWAGYTSLNEILLTSREFNSLKETQKIGLKEWVLNGGNLLFIDESAEQKELIQKLFGTTESSFGLGALKFVAPNTSTRSRLSSPVLIKNFEERYSSNAIKELWNSIQEPQVSVILVTTLLLLFLIFVGPVNIYVLAKKNRLRLLMTTPIISLIASAVFFLTIALYDGFGGEGIKKSFVWLNPQQNRCVINQSQIVNNSIMFNSSFKRQSDYLLKSYENPFQSRRYNNHVSSTQVISDGEWVSGDMFKSRSRRLMTLKDVRSTQASLEFIKGDVPSIRSNFKSSLTNIIVRDLQGKSWQAAACAPGEIVKLEAVDLTKKIPAVPLPNKAGERTESEKLFKKLKDIKTFFFTAETSGNKEFNIVTNTKTDWTRHDFLIGGDLLEGKL